MAMRARDFAGENVLNRSPECRRRTVGQAGIGEAQRAPLSPLLKLQSGTDLFKQAREVSCFPVKRLHAAFRFPGKQRRIVGLCDANTVFCQFVGEFLTLRCVAHDFGGHVFLPLFAASDEDEACCRCYLAATPRITSVTTVFLSELSSASWSA